MRVTRIVYWSIIVINLAVNVVSLLAVQNVLSGFSSIVPGVLLFNIIVLPIAIFGAYRIGGMAEEEYRKYAASNTPQAEASKSVAVEAVEKKSE